MFSQRFLDEARKADVYLHVVRAFDAPTAPYHDDINPKRDLEAVDVEMIVTDLGVVENRLERLKKSQNLKTPGHPDYQEQVLFTRIKEPLENGTPMRDMEFDEEELKIVRNYQFLSAKPTVLAFNVGENEAAKPGPAVAALIAEQMAKGTQSFAVCATIEEEIAQLDSADQPEFLESLGFDGACQPPCRAGDLRLPRPDHFLHRWRQRHAGMAPSSRLQCPQGCRHDPQRHRQGLHSRRSRALSGLFGAWFARRRLQGQQDAPGRQGPSSKTAT